MPFLFHCSPVIPEWLWKKTQIEKKLHFFEDENENWVTVDTDRYNALMRKKFILALRRKRRVDMNTVIYQQDGAPPRCSDRFLEFLGRYFPGDGLISRRINFPWPPYSPGLNPCTTSSGGTSRKGSVTIIPDHDRFEGQHKKGDQAHTSWHDRTSYQQIERSSYSRYPLRRCLNRTYY